MHPGWSDTEGVRSSIPAFHKAFQDKLRDTQQGVDTILWLALEVCMLLHVWDSEKGAAAEPDVDVVSISGDLC
jgi:hypothetical protein